MPELSLPGDPDVRVILRRSARARRLSLRISSLDGRVTLTLPKRVSEREGRAFLLEKEDWIRSHLARQPKPVAVRAGIRLPVEGRELDIRIGAGRRVEQRGEALIVPGSAPARRLERYLKELARDRLAAASDRYAARLGRSYCSLSLRDTRSRWGSCSAAGGLMYSWRLILAPPDVLTYVAAHEVAHLQEMNHSPAFWSVVEDLYGDYAAPRRWLQSDGNALHRYRFEDISEKD
ncbi:M48 family metallopeptidase [Epibacterium sp. Ofav1-8]|uniref:M48 family metallopeptidase n=1 Tax=Epibacterium sp. Ofav1-8 TaxID=2917735 RepID=UPI001EF65889|nr:SprT family zinc-dependent metalloprotease [Epibacterium sp. Ofav1-8]MCG7624017.1 M48 family metallopeptidase [Epibacterium sp. Ofav1-8]